MENAIVKAMLRDYEDTTAAHKVALGFSIKQDAYLIHLPCFQTNMVKLDHEGSSRGGALKLRMNLTMKVKAILKANGAVKVGTVSEVLAGRKNAGEAFEKWYTERAGQVWVKDSIPYYKDGDITINGEKIQIKWENASLANENTIRTALEWKLA